MLEKLAKYHNEWLKILYSFGCDYDDAQDLVQDMYLKINRLIELDKIKYGDGINKYYIYVTLKNLYIDKLKSSTFEFNEDVNAQDEEYDSSENDAMQKILDRVYEYISTLTVFERRLFEIYYDLPLNPNTVYSGYNRSLRDIAKGSNVSLTTIHLTLKKIKDKLVELYAEDVEDYFNRNYDKV